MVYLENDTHLLFSVYERLDEERHRQLRGNACDIRQGQQRLRNMTTYLPHETTTTVGLGSTWSISRIHRILLEIGMLEDVSILQEVSVVLPDPFFQLFAENLPFPLRRRAYSDESESEPEPEGGS